MHCGWLRLNVRRLMYQPLISSTYAMGAGVGPNKAQSSRSYTGSAVGPCGVPENRNLASFCLERAKSPPTHPEVEVPDQRDVPIASSAGFGLIMFPVLRTAWNAHLHRNTIRGPIFVTDMRIASMAPHRNPASKIVSLSGAKLAATELRTRSRSRWSAGVCKVKCPP